MAIFRLGSDPTYSDLGGGPSVLYPESPDWPDDDSPKKFSVNVIYITRIGVIDRKLGPWYQFENFNQLANLAER